MFPRDKDMPFQQYEESLLLAILAFCRLFRPAGRHLYADYRVEGSKIIIFGYCRVILSYLLLQSDLKMI